MWRAHSNILKFSIGLVILSTLAAATNVPPTEEVTQPSTPSSTVAPANPETDSATSSSSPDGTVEEPEELPTPEALAIPVPNFIAEFFGGRPRANGQYHPYNSGVKQRIPSTRFRQRSSPMDRQFSSHSMNDPYGMDLFGDNPVSINNYSQKPTRPRSKVVYDEKFRRGASERSSGPTYEYILDSNVLGIPPQEYDLSDNNIIDEAFYREHFGQSRERSPSRRRRPDYSSQYPQGMYSRDRISERRERYPSMRKDRYSARGLTASYNSHAQSKMTERPFWNGIFDAINPINLFRSSEPEFQRVPLYMQNQRSLNRQFAERRDMVPSRERDYSSQDRSLSSGGRNFKSRGKYEMYPRDRAGSRHYDALSSIYEPISLESSKRGRTRSYEDEIYRDDISRLRNSQGSRKPLQRYRVRKGFKTLGDITLRPSSPTPKWEPKRSRTPRPSSRSTTVARSIPTRRLKPTKKSRTIEDSQGDRKFVREANQEVLTVWEEEDEESPFKMTVSEGELVFEDEEPETSEDPRLAAFEFSEKSDLRDDLYVGKDGNIYIREKGSRKSETALPDSDVTAGYDMYGMSNPFQQEVSESHVSDIKFDEENLIYNHNTNRDFSTRRSRTTTMEELLKSSDVDYEDSKVTAHKRPQILSFRPVESDPFYYNYKD